MTLRKRTIQTYLVFTQEFKKLTIETLKKAPSFQVCAVQYVYEVK